MILIDRNSKRTIIFVLTLLGALIGAMTVIAVSAHKNRAFRYQIVLPLSTSEFVVYRIYLDGFSIPAGCGIFKKRPANDSGDWYSFNRWISVAEFASGTSIVSAYNSNSNKRSAGGISHQVMKIGEQNANIAIKVGQPIEFYLTAAQTALLQSSSGLRMLDGETIISNTEATHAFHIISECLSGR